MNFLHRIPDEEPIVPIAPMLDIVFLLLIFFITTSVFARMENELSITVPTAESATPPERALGELIINVKYDGTIIVNQRTISRDQLSMLLSRIAKQYPDQSVIIRGDRKAYLEYAMQILDTCAQAGVWNIQFAALPPEEKTGSS